MLSYRHAAVPALLALFAVARANGFDPWVQSARYEVEYRVDLTAWASAPEGPVRVWLPTPAENEHQRVHSKEVESPWQYRETRDDHGNRFVYLETGRKESQSTVVTMRFVVERSPFNAVEMSDARFATPRDVGRYVKPQRRIPLDGVIGELAERQSRGLESDGQKIRAFYDYVNRTMRYSKHGEGWGRGDAVWACDARYGNCTDFHSVFIGMARSQGIPARFVIGFPIPADKTEATIGGYHCWAEAYDRERGWLPLDASEAWKSKRFDDYFGKIPSDRIEFTVGRDLTLEPPQKGEPLNFFIYPYVELNGKPLDQVPWEVHVRRVSTKNVGE
jgi:transglutaminase-like putative cysteine protease